MPSGCPSAIAPPLTFTFAGSSPSSSMQTSDCEANASLSSTRSRSSTPSPARSRALRVAGTGPTPMTAGSTPATAVETTRAIGCRPSSRARPASTSSTADAPSLIPELLPAVTEPPSRLNAGRSLPSASIDVSARGCSSRSTSVDLALPSARPRPGRSGREPAGVDRRDGAPMALEREGVLPLASDAPALGDVLRGLAHRVRVVHLGELRVDEPPAERRVLELARSAVPGVLGLGHHVRRPRHRFDAAATKTSPSPTAIAWAAALIACRPEPHSRLTVWPATSTGKPARSAAIRATFAVVLACLIGAAEDDVLDDRGVDAGTVDDRAHHERREVIGADRGERPAVPTDRGPDGIDDPCLTNGTVRIRVIAADRSGSATRGRLAGFGRASDRGEEAIRMRHSQPERRHDIVVCRYPLVDRDVCFVGDGRFDPLLDPIRAQLP